jgi:hypothetical protein
VNCSGNPVTVVLTDYTDSPNNSIVNTHTHSSYFHRPG